MEHVPVLLNECIDALKVSPNGIYIDGTLGLGGHTREIAKRLTTGRVLAIDRDAEAIKEARGRLSEYSDRISYIHGNFRDIATIMDDAGIELADGMLFDLGISSFPQLDNSERGFSHSNDGPLDMRMDRSEELTAFEAVNEWPEDKLRRTFYEYGEERYAKLIARAIVNKRKIAPIATTLELSGIIIAAMPAAGRREAQHPAKRCFSALRLAINDELGSIADMLSAAPDRLKTGGRICVISFHSLESRLVRGAFAARVSGCICPKDLPVCACGFTPTLKLINRKPIKASINETERNPRARSSSLRIAERV